MSGLVQWAIHTVETWCNEVGLLVYPDKIELVVFTRKRKHSGFFEPNLFSGLLFKSLCVRQVSRSSPGFSSDLEGACGCEGKKGSQFVVGL
jgi:hypothetical protein